MHFRQAVSAPMLQAAGKNLNQVGMAANLQQPETDWNDFFSNSAGVQNLILKSPMGSAIQKTDDCDCADFNADGNYNPDCSPLSNYLKKYCLKRKISWELMIRNSIDDNFYK